MFSADIGDNPPKGTMGFIIKVRNAEAVLFAVPKYNFSIPGAIKNAIDWESLSGHDLKDKPTFIVGDSMSVLGSVREQKHPILHFNQNYFLAMKSINHRSSDK